ncbi:MAG: transposase [Thermomicrobiales bacterium]
MVACPGWSRRRWCWGVCAALAAELPEWRSVVHHTREALVRQRVFQIACGYEDQDDADALRTDPLLDCS